MTVAYCKRLIEVDLPIKRISAHARREKSIRHGHISTLHIWWARRPLAACRAVICASLWPDPADPLCPERFVREAERILRDRQRRLGGKVWKWSEPVELREALLDFIADFADWDNSNNKEYLAAARGLTQVAHETLGGEPGTRPLVVDPFAGGGAIPLEALRVGATPLASDLNPIPVLLNRIALENVPRFGGRLPQEVRIQAERMAHVVAARMRPFYPVQSDGANPIAYLWARCVQCEGPACGASVPLVASCIIAKRSRHIFVRFIHSTKDNAVYTEVQEGTPASRAGTVLKGALNCPVCKYTTPSVAVRAQLVTQRGGATTGRLIAAVVDTQQGRQYRTPASHDWVANEEAARAYAAELADPETARWYPAEDLPSARPSPNARGLSPVARIGVRTFLDLYAPRQALAISTFARAVAEVPLEYPDEPELGRAVAACIAVAVDKQADFNSSFARWASHMEKSVATFGRNALPVLWDWAETVPIANASGSFKVAAEWVASALDGLADLVGVIGGEGGSSLATTATRLPYPDSCVSAFISDPPYYDAVPYADLSDYFYVWLRRMLVSSYPSLFSSALTPKNDEIIWNPSRILDNDGRAKDEAFYESGMQAAFREARRVVQDTGIGVVVFAHKSAAGWEAVLKALIDAGWVATGSWPIDTEKPSRMNAQGTASLASSVHIVCRPRTTNETGNWRDVLRELPVRIRDWLPRLAAEGVVGADAIFACLGPALEIFSRYEHVEKVSGETVTLREYLEHVWAAVSREALAMIFNDPETAGLGEDARLTAMWLWTLAAPGGDAGPADDDDEASSDDDDDDGPKKKPKSTGGFVLEYDAARKISQGLGCKLESLPHLVEVKGDKARLLPVGERTRHLFGKDSQNQLTAAKPIKKRQPTLFEAMGVTDELASAPDWGDLQPATTGSTVLDRIHQSMLLFAAGRSEGLKHFLVDDGVGKNVQFWKLAQALSALYPSGTDEKRWVDGVLARKKGLGY